MARAVWSHPPPGAAGAMIFISDWAKADVAMTQASAAPANDGMILNDIVSSSTSSVRAGWLQTALSGTVAGRRGSVPWFSTLSDWIRSVRGLGIHTWSHFLSENRHPLFRKMLRELAGKSAGRQKGLLLGRGSAPEHLVTVREAAEAADDIGMMLSPAQVVGVF